jgi:PAS domain S-box-containing protein
MSEERYHQMIAEVQDYAIIFLDTQGNIQNWNTGAEFIKGYHSTEIQGKNFEIFYTEHDRIDGLPNKLLSEAAKHGRAHHEGWRVRKDGSKFWGNTVITALHNKKGNLIGFSKVTRDLTEKKSAEDKLLRYAAELESQNKELEQFAYIASHDLQEPLRKIQTFAELIQDNLKDEQVVKRYFDKIQDSAKRMAELIKSVLNFSKLSQIEAEAVEVDLNVIVANILADFELLIAERHAIITVDHLPTIKGISLHLSQLFANLISNGIKFAQTEPRISVRCDTVTKSQVINAPDFLEDIPYYQISITDNGIGFDQQYEKLIFQMFKRLHARQHYAGTGIGLALCKKIIENHHGYIAAQGELGIGSTFYVYLPMH